MAQITAKTKIENYTSSEPSISYGGRDVSLTVYINDDYLELNVELGWDGVRDEVEIESINAKCYDADDKTLDTSSMDLEALVIEIFDKHNTFGWAEAAMLEAYHNDHA